VPVQQRIDYKVALLTLKVRSTSTPSYLRLLIQDREHGRNLRSTTTALCQPSTTTFAKRGFRCSAPAVWILLPKTVLSSDSGTVFNSTLEAFLFFSLSSSHMRGPGASDTTLWRYTNMFIIIYIAVSVFLCRCAGYLGYLDPILRADCFFYSVSLSCAVYFLTALTALTKLHGRFTRRHRIYKYTVLTGACDFSASTLMVGWQEEYPSCRH